MVTMKRIYKGSDAGALTTCDTIITTAISNKERLIAKRSGWKDPFFTDLQKKIADAFKVYLGVDSAKDLRAATALIIGMQTDVIKTLSQTKVQVEEDFKNNKARREEILKQLGFTDFFKKVQSRNQEALIEMLFRFKANLLTDLKQEIVNKGTAAATLESILAYADQLEALNVSQETLKGGRKDVTAAAVTEFNAIYSEVISICRIVSRLFADDKLFIEKFSYSRILKQLSASQGNGNKEEPTANLPASE